MCSRWVHCWPGFGRLHFPAATGLGLQRHPLYELLLWEAIHMGLTATMTEWAARRKQGPKAACL